MIPTPKLKHRWRIHADGALDDPILSQMVQECSRPTLNFTDNGHEWEPLHMVLEEDQDNNISRLLQKQMKAQMDAWDMGHVETYEFDMMMEYVNGDGIVTGKCEIFGCWLQNVSYDSLDYSDSDAMKISVDIRFRQALWFDVKTVD